MSFADTGDVAALLGRTLTASEGSQVVALLDAAETIILQRVPDLISRATSDDLFMSLVLLVEAKSARRVMMNPTGARQRSETLDDYTQSETLDTAISTGDVYITDDEWQLLGVGATSAATFSMAKGYR